MSVTLHVESELKLQKEIVIEKLPYMTDDELRAHIKDAEKMLGNKYTFEQLVRKLDDMGFNIVETVTDVLVVEKANVKRVEIKDDVY